MTPQEIQRTMDFILRSQADSVIRMQRMEEDRKKWEQEAKAENAEIRKTVKSISREIRDLLKSQRNYEKSQRNYEKRLRTLQESDRRQRRRYEGVRDIMRILTRLAGTHSKRLDRLERNGR